MGTAASGIWPLRSWRVRHYRKSDLCLGLRGSRPAGVRPLQSVCQRERLPATALIGKLWGVASALDYRVSFGAL